MNNDFVSSSFADPEISQLLTGIQDFAIYKINPDGIVVSWNLGAEQMKGYTAAEVVGQSDMRFFTPEDQAEGRPAEILATARAVGHYAGEAWRVRKDGTRFWASVVVDAILDDKGRCIGFAKFTRDLSAKRAILEELRSSEQRLRLLIDSIVDYAIFTMDIDGTVTSWNAGAERAKGYREDEILGQNYAIFHTPEDQAAGNPARALAIARDTGQFVDEGWRVRKSGERFWASVVIDPMRDEAGILVGFAKVTRDITEKRALEQAKDELYQAQKMDTVGQLTGGVAHDFNNLLTAISCSLEGIALLNQDGRVQHLVEVAQRAADRGARLTHQLLAFARRQDLRPTASNVNHLIVSFDMLFRRAAGDSIEVEFDFGTELWLSDVDPAQFQLALLNLVVNARDAMPNGGTLSIATENVVIDPATAATWHDVAPGEFVAITVRDTGIGMSKAIRERAIEPFFTTKDVGQGSGLGLSQVYGFVRQSDGHIRIDSQVGYGTSVILYLPKSEKPELVETAAPAGSVNESFGSVLVVEDDPDVLEIVLQVVKDFGYDALSARDSIEALAIMEQRRPIDLLFTDVVMPNGTNGVELAREARVLQPGIRVLLTSGYSRDALKKHSGFTETMAFITKPYSLSSLRDKLGETMRSALN